MSPIDLQFEFMWTVVWSFLAAWTFGAVRVWPPSSSSIILTSNNGWNGPNLFFVLCVGFYELSTKAVTNPAYWWKDRIADLVSKRSPPQVLNFPNNPFLYFILVS